VSDETPSEDKKPRLKVVPPMNRTGGRPSPITVSIYRTAEKYWCEGNRSLKDLARFLQVSKKCATNLVHKGLKKLRLRPLAESAKEYDRQADAARAKALNLQVDLEANELALAKRKNLEAAGAVRGLSLEMLLRIRVTMNSLGLPGEAVQGGEAAVRSRALAMQPLVHMLRSLSMALREAAASEFTWIQGTAPTKDEDAREMAANLSGVTPEQWETYFRTGEFPPGMSAEALKELAKQGFKTMMGGG
jgi:hypothetical protein